MKAILFSMVLLCTSATAQITSFPYTEDFESGPGGWASGTSNFVDSWILGTPNYNVINQAAPGGTMSWYTDTTDFETSEYSHVISPEFDFSGLNYPIISLDIWWDLVTDVDGAVLQSSTNGGSSWQNVGHHDDNEAMATNWYNHAFLSQGFPTGGAGLQQVSHWSGDSLDGSQGWVTASHFLEGLGGESSVFFRFAWANRGGNANRPANNVAFDNILIEDGPEVDLTVTAIDQAGPCGGGYEGQAYIIISNSGGGSATVTEIEDDQGNTYPLDNPVVIGPFSTERVLVSLPLQNPGTPTMVLGVGHPDDFNFTNDFMSVTFDCQVINGMNHCNDFEPGGTQPWWVDPESVNPSFVLGPNSSNVSINTPSPTGGSQFWGTTNGSGTYNTDEQSSIISNFYNLDGLVNLAIAFELVFDFEQDFDGAVMQYSLDGGQTWVTLGAQGSGTNWYNYGSLYGPGAGGQNSQHWNGYSGLGWVGAVWEDLNELQGIQNVLFRFSIGSDFIGQDGGLGLDNFCISGELPPIEPDTPNVVINEFNYIDFNGNQLDFIELKNIGTDTVDMSTLQVNCWSYINASQLPYEIFGSPPLTGLLAPNEYYVIGAQNGVANADISPFSETGENIYADTGAVQVRWFDGGVGITLDEVGYGGSFGSHFETLAIQEEDAGDFFSTDLGFSRAVDGVDTDNNFLDFGLRCVTPGAANSTETFCLPGDTVDVAITDVTQIGPCGGGFSTPVRLTFENLGYFDQTITEVSDNLGNTYTLPSSVTLSQGETGVAIVDMLLVSSGTINLTVTVNQPNDQNSGNNSSSTLFNCNVAVALDYEDDFEDPEFFRWYAGGPGMQNSSWNHGENTDNVNINTPSPNAPGTKYWCTNNGGSYNLDEDSWVTSPYFDFATSLFPVFKAEIWVDLQTDIDGVVLERSLDGGSSWVAIGDAFSGQNWYEAGPLANGGAGDQNVSHWSGHDIQGSQGWITAIKAIPELAGLTNVLLRFALRSDTTVVDEPGINEGGFAFDNMEIRERITPDVVINEFNYVDIRGEQYDFVEIKNTGTVDVQMEEFKLTFFNVSGGMLSNYEVVSSMTGPLGPGQYYLIGDTSGFLIPDLETFDASGAVLGDTAGIALEFIPTDNLVDLVAYGSGTIPLGEGQSINFADPGNHYNRGAGFSRIPDGVDTDDNDDDFSFRCITPGGPNNDPNSVCFTPKLVINEFNYADPSGEEFDFVELKNIDTVDIDLGDFRLDNFNFLNGTSINLNGNLAPNDYYVVGAMNGVPSIDLSYAVASDYVVGLAHSLALKFLPRNVDSDLVGLEALAPAAEGAPISTSDDGSFVEYLQGYSRIPDGVDGNNNDADFQVRCHTPGEENGGDSTCVSVMVINEVDKLGATGDSVHVELFNRTPIQADLDGFILEFDDAANLDSIILDGTIGIQGYRVFSIPSAGFDSDHVTIMLQDTQSTTIVDRLTIAQNPIGLPNTENEFTTLDASQTLSISRIPNGEDTNDNGNDFALVCATLGSENFNDLSCDLVGLGEELSVEIRLYPNPARDFITLETGNSDQFDIQIIDAMGRIAKTVNLSNQGRIDISGLVSGVYSIIATDSIRLRRTAVGRFIKQ